MQMSERTMEDVNRGWSFISKKRQRSRKSKKKRRWFCSLFLPWNGLFSDMVGKVRTYGHISLWLRRTQWIYDTAPPCLLCCLPACLPAERMFWPSSCTQSHYVYNHIWKLFHFFWFGNFRSIPRQHTRFHPNGLLLPMAHTHGIPHNFSAQKSEILNNCHCKWLCRFTKIGKYVEVI